MDEKKTQIENMIVDAILMGLEKKQVTEADLPKIADYVLKNIEPIASEDQLFAFLDELSLRWPIFENIRQVERGIINQFLEKQLAQQALKLIQSGKFTAATATSAQATGGIK